MKRLFFTLFLCLLFAGIAMAQAPAMFNYQGVARNAVGNVMGNKNISLRLTIRQGSANGGVVYSETRSVTTNPFGLFTVQVGGPGATQVTGTVGGVEWYTGNKFIQVEIDPDGGSAFLQIGTTELLAVPFALYSQSGLPIGPAGSDLTGTYPNPTVARLRGVNIVTTAPATNDVLGFDGTNWKPTSLATHPGNYWRADGTNLYNTNTGNMGVGTTAPAYKLDVKAATDDHVMLIENTGSADGDGLLIKLGKTHPRWNGSDFISVPNPGAQGLETQVNKIRDYVYGTATFNISDLALLMPSQYIPGTICNITNMVTDQINNTLSLPLQIGPYNTPAIHIWGETTIFGGIDLDFLGSIPALKIPALDIPSVQVLPRITVMPRIPAIPCGFLPSLSLPVLGFTDVSNSLTKENEFITFADKEGRKLGAIRARSIQNFSYDYFDGPKLLDIAAQIIGIDIAKDAVGIAAATAEMADAYNKIGVEYWSGNGDYAEWLERIDSNETISAGDIIAVKAGKISKNLVGAEQIMAVSSKPIVLGNMPAGEKAHTGNIIAFMGQIPVKVTTPVCAGDFIVAKGGVPGYGVAVNPAQMTTTDYRLAIGRSWETNERSGPKMVNTVVGVHNNEFLKIIEGLQRKIDDNERRLQAIEERLNGTSPAAPAQKKGF